MEEIFYRREICFGVVWCICLLSQHARDPTKLRKYFRSVRRNIGSSLETCRFHRKFLRHKILKIFCLSFLNENWLMLSKFKFRGWGTLRFRLILTKYKIEEKNIAKIISTLLMNYKLSNFSFKLNLWLWTFLTRTDKAGEGAFEWLMMNASDVFLEFVEWLFSFLPLHKDDIIIQT